MATADKLSYLSQTKTAIKEAIVEKGVDVSSSDTFRSYADKIKSIQAGGGAGGSKLYVYNETGKEFVEGDKVLVNFSGTEGTTHTSKASISSGWTKSFVTSDGRIIASSNYGKIKYEAKWTPNGFVSSAYTNIEGYVDSRFSYVFSNDRLSYCIVNDNKRGIEDYTNLTFTITNQFPLTDDLYLDTSNGIIYNSDKSLSFDTGRGSMNNNFMPIQVFENTLVIGLTTDIHMIDFTNFPECVKTSIPMPATCEMPLGMTGIGEGSFLVFVNGNTLNFYQRTGKGFKKYADVVMRNKEVSHTINIGEGVFCLIRDDNTPVVYMTEGDSLIRKQLPIEMFNKIKKLATGNIYGNRITFSTNRDMKIFVTTYATGNYDNFVIYSHIGEDVKTYIADPEQANYTPDYSFTGYATGKKSEDGRIEVAMLLSEEIPITIETNVPVTDSEIIFEGIK
jgi:hypothetical protein